MNAIPTLSFFEKLYLPESVPCTLEEIIILIRTRRWEAVITAYRASLAAGDKEGARKQKGQLPGFTPSGVFRGGHRANQLEQYSGIVGLDFDPQLLLKHSCGFCRMVVYKWELYD